MKTTSLIGQRCTHSNVFSRLVLITRRLDLYHADSSCFCSSPLFSFQGASPGRCVKWPDGQVVKTGASHAPIGGSTPPRVTISYIQYAPLAQLVEHLTLNQGVQGSSP